MDREKRVKYRRKPMGGLLAAVLLSVLLGGCTGNERQENIVILYTNDVHCAVDENIGYAGLAAYKKGMEEKTPYVTLVDCGDAIQGGTIGLLSKGQYPVQMMNRVGYDVAVLGNHEFDYGMEQLASLLESAEAAYVDCNIRYTGSGENLLATVKPYKIVSYENTNVAYVGICTPENITSSTPAFFCDESGGFVYDFYGEGDGEAFYRQIQDTVDECRGKGADYVVALAHLGIDESSEPFRSTDLIERTEGIDAVLDGHSHSVIPCQIVKDKKGEEVLLSSTGTALNYIGQLVITPDGLMTAGLVNYAGEDADTAAYVQEIRDMFAADLQKVVGRSEVPMHISSEKGIRMVRNRETAIGDFCADAYRAVSGADVAIVNGGGIRADLSAGEITYEDVLAVHPYGNTLCVVEASGQDILDVLEAANRDVLAETDDGENPVGENGGFLQVSGIRFTVDTSVSSTVLMDENGMFISCGENRRVKEVEILQGDGSYAALDPKGTYTLASQNYLLKSGGDGLNLFVDHVLLTDDGKPDYQVLIDYIDSLGGVIGKEYESPQGRITVE